MSATAIGQPEFNKPARLKLVAATPPGDEKFPSPTPREPKLKAWVPLGWKAWMRWLPVSATRIMLRFFGMRSVTSTPPGDEKFPSPAPREPKLKSRVPFGWKTWMRWLPVSAT